MQDDKTNKISDLFSDLTSALSDENSSTPADGNFEVLGQINKNGDDSGYADVDYDAMFADLFEQKKEDNNAAGVVADTTSSKAPAPKTSPKAAPKNAPVKPAASAAKTAGGASEVKNKVNKHRDNTAFREIDARNSAQKIENLLDSGKLTQALDQTFSLEKDMLDPVKSIISVKIPLGSRDSELRQIASGALIQSYLDCKKIDRADIENKLYAIIESSKPELNEKNEPIRQSPEDVLYKVTACTVFAAELVERSGSHPTEKNAMYGADDSVLDQILSENLGRVRKQSKKHLELFTEAVKASGGEVGEKYMSYYGTAKKDGAVISKFFGDSVAFKCAAGVIIALCLVSLWFYITSKSSILAFVAKDSALMLYVLMAEIFFVIGMALLCVIIGFGGKMKSMKKEKKEKKTK